MSGIAALLLAAAAALQEPPAPRNGSEIVPRQGYIIREDAVFSLTAEVKLTLPVDGEIVPSTNGFLFTLPVKGTSYEDIFSSGTGLMADARPSQPNARKRALTISSAAARAGFR